MIIKIETKEQLFEVIKQIHFSCHKLCKQAFDTYLPNSGNIGVFCHYDDEYKNLVNIRENLTIYSDNPEQKYFKLIDPILITAKEDIPETFYTHLYIRKPDHTSYGEFTGDIDFYLEKEEYDNVKKSLINNENIKGASVYDRPGWDMIQLTDPEIDAVAYVSTKEMTEAVHVKIK